MIDRVEIAIIEENQPRWLSFLRREFDLVDEVPAEYAPIAFPNNKLAPNLAKLGLQMVRFARADVAISYFNMEDPVVGGYTPDKVALRRAISLAIDIDKEIRLPRRGQAVAAQGPISPGVFGHEPTLKTTMSEHDLARARALLDLYGYVDRDGDGWREQPDGSPLTIEYATEQDGEKRALAELWQKAMDAIQVRIKFRLAKWPENLKASTSGKLMMWGVGWSATSPDGDTFLALGYGPNKSQANKARFDLPAYNALYEQQKSLPNGPERLALMTEAQKLIVAYMPIKMHVHRVYTDLAQPWIDGYHRNLFVRNFLELHRHRRRGRPSPLKKAGEKKQSAPEAGGENIVRKTWTAGTQLLATLLLCVSVSSTSAAPAAEPGPAHVLRMAFPIAETSLDPAQISDEYSREIVSNIFESPLAYDYLARPVRLKPLTAAALPEVNADFSQFTLRIKPGILFAADPAFKGKPRELVAADYAYALKRHFDPKLRSPHYANLENEKILGLEALRQRSLKSGKPFDYDAPVDGLQTPDRHTLIIKLGRPSPRFSHMLAQTLSLAVAREVVEAYGDTIGEHPVGTGPFVLKEWRRASRLVLERNPTFREAYFDEEPAADDAAAQAVARQLEGRRLPLVERVEVSIVTENQPRWLAYLGNEFDFVIVPNEYASLAAPGGAVSAASGQARHEPAPEFAVRCDFQLLQYGRSRRGRLHAREGGPAPRHQPGL